MSINKFNQSEINHIWTTSRPNLLFLLVALVMSGLVACGPGPNVQANAQSAEAEPVSGPEDGEPLRILYVMSYHSPWEWTDNQWTGFQEGLGQDKVESQVIQLDAKRKSAAEVEQIAQEAREVIDTWQPDLLYLNDDVVQKQVASYYVNTDLPIVFSGVNANPAEYGYTGSLNVTGVLEQEHYLASVRLLVDMVPDAKRIAVVIDDDPTWDGVTARMKAQASQLPEGVEIVRWDKFLTYAEYQQAIAEYQTEVDAIALLGVFTFKDEHGANVPFEEVLQWTTENSNLPDFSFWDSRIPYGTLAAVTVSGYEQGYAAGQMARQILVEGVSPVDIEMKPTVKGEPVINMARVRKLGLTLDSTLLLSAQVINQYAWEE